MKKICIVCKKRKIEDPKWICSKCYKYLGKKIIANVITECGGDYSKIPDHIPVEQEDNYFVSVLLKRKEEQLAKKSKNIKEKKKKPISIASRKNKGRLLQKWIANKISDITGIPCGKDELIESRGGGQSGTDVILIGKAKKLFPFSVEAKSQETYSMPSFIKQAKNNQLNNTDWLLVIKRKHENPTITMDADRFFELYEKTMPKKPYFEKEPKHSTEGVKIQQTHVNTNNPNFSGNTH